MIGRVRSEEQLHGQAIGSFLVRLSSHPLCFALDLSQEAGPHHILCMNSNQLYIVIYIYLIYNFL